MRIINVARGGIIDEQALLDALQDGRCSGVALDVFAQEPPGAGSVSAKLIQHPSVICTPHLGASTCEAQQRVATEIAQQLLDLIHVSVQNFKLIKIIHFYTIIVSTLMKILIMITLQFY